MYIGEYNTIIDGAVYKSKYIIIYANTKQEARRAFNEQIEGIPNVFKVELHESSGSIYKGFTKIKEDEDYV